jgi:hypothetical protein
LKLFKCKKADTTLGACFLLPGRGLEKLNATQLRAAGGSTEVTS